MITPIEKLAQQIFLKHLATIHTEQNIEDIAALSFIAAAIFYKKMKYEAVNQGDFHKIYREQKTEQK